VSFFSFLRRKTAKKPDENSYWNPEVGDRLRDRPKDGSIYGGDVARIPKLECTNTARTVRTWVSGPRR